MRPKTSGGLKVLAVAVLLAVAAPAMPADAAWILPAQRLENQGEQDTSVTTGDIGTGARSVVLFAQGREGAPIAPFTVESPLGPPAWTSPAALTLPPERTAGSGYQVSVSSTGNARGVILTGGFVYRFLWNSGGAAAIDPTPILEGISGGSVKSAMTPDGALHVIAAKAAAPKPIVYVRLAPDGTPGAELEVAEKDASEHDLAVSAGGVAVSYTKTTGSGTSQVKDVVVSRLLPGQSEFSEEADGLVPSTPNPADQPAVAIDPAGHATIAFRETPPATGGVVPNRQKTRYARFLADSPQIGSPRDLSQPPAPPAPPQSGPENQNPDVVADGAGRVTFLWEERGDPSIVSRELVGGVLSIKQSLGTGQRAALGVTPSGLAIAVFQNPPDQSAAIVAMERPTGNLWGEPTTLSLTGPDAGRAGFAGFPRLTVTPTQADTFFLQAMGPEENNRTNAGVAARYLIPQEPQGPPETPVTDARGCPPANATQSGGGGDDNLVGTLGNDNLLGAGGNDTLVGLTGDDCVRGEDGNDNMGGDDGNDTLVGGPGDDLARGNDGDDIVVGGDGNDRLTGAAGTDRVEGEEGDDRLGGGSGPDAVFGGPGSDRLSLQSGNDLGLGGDGNDSVNGGSGKDLLFGEGGDDNLAGSTGNDRLYGGDGNDRLRGNRGRDFLLGGAGIDRLFGHSANDLLIGGDGDDVLSGNSGNDRLAGRAGDDRIRGGSGVDRITGGPGDDRIWPGTSNDLVNSGSGDDVIYAAGGGRDTVRCGGGRDLVTADSRDRVARNCEVVRIRRGRAASRSAAPSALTAFVW